MTAELNAAQTERGAETGTNVGQPWEAKFMNLDRLLIWMNENKGVDAPWGIAFDEIRPEVEALQARVRVLEGALKVIRLNYGKVCSGFELCTHESCRSSYSAWAVADETLKGSPAMLAEARATLEGKDAVD